MDFDDYVCRLLCAENRGTNGVVGAAGLAPRGDKHKA